ncbi:MAG: hypothetical protein WBB01_18490, partial [Phormidesmis sp.]
MSSTTGTAANTSIAVKRDTYLKHLLTQAAVAAGASGLGLNELRERAIALVNERSFPSGKDEEWRFTELSDLLTLSLDSAERSKSLSCVDILRPNLVLLEPGYRLASVNGHYASALSDRAPDRAAKLSEGVIISPLSELLDHPEYGQPVREIVSRKLAQVQGGGEVFTALNTAGFSDVMVVWLRADQVVDAPVHIARGAVGEAISHLRTLVIAE